MRGREFRIHRTEGMNTVAEGDPLAWGYEFPCGRCYVQWNRDAYPEEHRLDNTHISVYGSVDDIRTAIGGKIVFNSESGAP